MADNLNLKPERGPNIWEHPPRDERRTSEIAGAVLLAAGAVSAFAGGMMLYRAMRHDRGRSMTRPWKTARRSDLVGEESEASFPASDPPSWTSGGGATLDLPRRTH